MSQYFKLVADSARSRRCIVMRWTRWLLISCLIVGWVSLPTLVSAQSPPIKISIGLGSNVKLGKWSPIFIDAEPGFAATRFETEVLDGDDTPVIYAGPLLTDPGRPGHWQAWTRLGRTYGGIQLRLFDSSDQLVAERELSIRGDNRIADFRESTRTLIVTLEPEEVFKNAIESVSSISAQGKTRLITSLGSEEELPLNWLGYDGVDSVLLVTSDLARIERMTDMQLAALEAWVDKGGTLILSAAKHGEILLGEGGRLNRFGPGEYAGLGEITNSSRLETFSDSRDQLIPLRGQPLPVTIVDDLDSQVIVDDGKSQPLVINQAMGLGQVVFVAFDLDSERIVNWKGFTSLVSRLVSGSDRQDEEQSVQRSSRGSSVSHFGYEDLIGQLRVPLDQFSQVQFVRFALIAALIGLYILCIGPGDYFLLRKVFGKMEMTWVTFPLVSLIFCGLAIGISRMTRPSEIQLNQLEIIDVDSVENRVRGTVWTNLYSPHGEDCSLQFEKNHGLGFAIDSDLISWHGLPGDGLGGMMSTANPGLLKTSYREIFELADNGQDFETRIEGMPLQVSSTKPIFTHWWADNPVRIRSRLKLNQRTQQLSGVVTNPFDFTLSNVRLVFENWAYLLDEPLKAGDAFDIQTETNEKTLKSMLTRKIKRSKNDRSDNSPWDPTDTRVNRIADLMMFFEAAGGSNYTGLTHDYQPVVDMTQHLDLKRAILVGEVTRPGAVLNINGQSTVKQYDQVTTIVRVVYPVEYLQNRNSN